MSLLRLRIQNIRNISLAELALHQKTNLFVGRNGSGKTSLLEAVNFLASGRSFRSRQLDPLVRRGQSDCTVFGVLRRGEKGELRLGNHRGLDGSREMKISGQSEKRASELAKKLPVLVLGPETVDLLLDPPSIRRRFLNWGVFHVEPQFSDIWIAANRNLRQRNEILKRQGRTGSELDTWTMKLIELSEQIHVHRELYCQRFSAIFEEISGALTELHEIKCEYHRGWANQKDLATVYQEEMDSDLKRGYTQSGFHRADLKVSVAGQSAMTVCSRGELKVLAWSLIMSQGALLTTESGQQPVFLVDDLVSELDKEHREKICQHLIKNEGQVLATGVEAEMLKECWGVASRKVFHVELGNFTEEE